MVVASVNQSASSCKGLEPLHNACFEYTSLIHLFLYHLIIQGVVCTLVPTIPPSRLASAHLPLHKGGSWSGNAFQLPLTFCLPGDIVSPSKWRGRRRAEISSCPERDVFGASILQLPSAVPLPSCPGHDRDGTLPLQRTQAARCRALLAIRVEPWDHQFELYASPLNQSQG